MRLKSDIAAGACALLLGVGVPASAAAGAPPAAVRRADHRDHRDHRLGNRLIKEGARLHNEGRYEEAIARFQQAYEKDPALTRVLLLIGASALNLGRSDEALASYERYEAAEPSLSPEERVRLHAYYDEAAAKIEDDLRRDPRRAELWLLAGRARYDLGQLGPALERYARYAREARPAGAARERLNEHLEALRERLLVEERQGPGRKEVLLLLSRVCGELGRKDEAAGYYARYQALLPRRPLEVQAAPAAEPPATRPRWRLALGGVALGGGAIMAGFGVSALSVNGGCQEALPAPQTGCAYDYATTGVGAGLLGAGLATAAVGAILLALPPRRPPARRNRMDEPDLGAHPQ